MDVIYTLLREATSTPPSLPPSSSPTVCPAPSLVGRFARPSCARPSTRGACAHINGNPSSSPRCHPPRVRVPLSLHAPGLQRAAGVVGRGTVAASATIVQADLLVIFFFFFFPGFISSFSSLLFFLFLDLQVVSISDFDHFLCKVLKRWIMGKWWNNGGS